jgi:DeoR/GlpR family transcriptional regulator of sugar metabolism
MIAMAVQDDWIPVEKASEIAGCSEQYIRRDLDAHLPKDDKGKPLSDRTVGGRLEGWRVHGKAWLVSRRSAEAIRETLSTRARLHEAQRATKKAAPKKRARRKK